MIEKKLTNYQADILKAIVNDSIKVISYRNPQVQLWDIAKDKSLHEVSEALDSLENDFGVLTSDSTEPTLRFGIFSECEYKVKLDEVKQLYDSYAREKRE